MMGSEFFKYYREQASVIARRAVVASVEQMLASFAPATREHFAYRFAEPMARAAKVASWRELPTDKLHGLHDLCARTPGDKEPNHE